MLKIKRSLGEIVVLRLPDNREIRVQVAGLPQNQHVPGVRGRSVVMCIHADRDIVIDRPDLDRGFGRSDGHAPAGGAA